MQITKVESGLPRTVDNIKPVLDDHRREYSFQLCARYADSLVESGMISSDECCALKREFNEIFLPAISGFICNKT